MSELVRFYGGTPMTWLAETPIVIVRACLRQLPRLRAKETLRQRAMMMSAFGSTSKGDQQRYISALSRQVDDAPAATPQVTPARLSAMGIAFVPVPTRTAS